MELHDSTQKGIAQVIFSLFLNHSGRAGCPGLLAGEDGVGGLRSPRIRPLCIDDASLRDRSASSPSGPPAPSGNPSPTPGCPLGGHGALRPGRLGHAPRRGPGRRRPGAGPRPRRGGNGPDRRAGAPGTAPPPGPAGSGRKRCRVRRSSRQGSLAPAEGPGAAPSFGTGGAASGWAPKPRSPAGAPGGRPRHRRKVGLVVPPRVSGAVLWNRDSEGSWGARPCLEHNGDLGPGLRLLPSSSISASATVPQPFPPKLPPRPPSPTKASALVPSVRGLKIPRISRRSPRIASSSRSITSRTSTAP